MRSSSVISVTIRSMWARKRQTRSSLIRCRYHHSQAVATYVPNGITTKYDKRLIFAYDMNTFNSMGLLCNCIWLEYALEWTLHSCCALCTRAQAPRTQENGRLRAMVGTVGLRRHRYSLSVRQFVMKWDFSCSCLDAKPPLRHLLSSSIMILRQFPVV